MSVHNIKLETCYFDAVLDGHKTFEIRFNDRDYKVGDTVVLNEFIPAMSIHTGRSIVANIGYLTDYEQREGYVVFSLRLTHPDPPLGINKERVLIN